MSKIKRGKTLCVFPLLIFQNQNENGTLRFILLLILQRFCLQIRNAPGTPWHRRLDPKYLTRLS